MIVWYPSRGGAWWHCGRGVVNSRHYIGTSSVAVWHGPGGSQRLAARHPHRGPALRRYHRLHLRVDLLRRVARHHRCNNNVQCRCHTVIYHSQNSLPVKSSLAVNNSNAPSVKLKKKSCQGPTTLVKSLVL